MKRFPLLLLFLILTAFFISSCGKSGQEAETVKKEPEKIERFLDTNSDLEDYFIHCLYSDGPKLWIGCRKGLYLYENGSLSHAPEPANVKFKGKSVRCIESDGQGTLFIGTDSGLSIWSEMTGFRDKDLGRVNTIFWSDRCNTLYVGTDLGVAYKAGGRWEYMDKKNSFFKRIDEDQNIGNNMLRVLSIAEDSDGTLWFGTGDGLVRYGGRDSRHYYGDHRIPGLDGSIGVIPGNSDLAGNIVNSILILGKEKWVASGGGLNCIENEDGFWKKFTATHTDSLTDKQVEGNSALSGHWVTGLSHKNGWIIISTTNGISLFNPVKNSWRVIGREQGLSSLELTGVSFHREDLFAASQWGLYRIPASLLSSITGINSETEK